MMGSAMSSAPDKRQRGACKNHQMGRAKGTLPKMTVLKKNIVANFGGSLWTGLMSLVFVPLYIRFMGIESREMFSRITLIEMSSTSPETIRHVKDLLKSDETMLVILDSCHTKKHVLDELESYHDLITPGSYIVAPDGVMKALHDVPRGKPEWAWDNPVEAVNDFVKIHPEFVLEQP